MPRPARSVAGLRVLGAAAAGGLAALAASAAWLWAATPSVDDLRARAWAATQEAEAVSPHVLKALIATEDRRFFQHPGIDLHRIGGALWATACGHTQGASTLTQQLARNLFPQRIGRERTVGRKLREMVVAFKLEHHFAKPEILALYLDTVPFRARVTGFEMAGQSYFGKPASALDVHEAALLVALLKGPSYYDPLRWPERARQRRDLVLRLMGEPAARVAPLQVAAPALPPEPLTPEPPRAQPLPTEWTPPLLVPADQRPDRDAPPRDPRLGVPPAPEREPETGWRLTQGTPPARLAAVAA